MKKVTNDIYYCGVNDHKIDLFEGQYKVPNGMAYNSYLIMDKKIAIMDTVDKNFTDEWLDNLEEVLNGKKPDYLIIQHMEPDHSANIMNFLKVYPETTIVGNVKTFKIMEQFFNTKFENKLEVSDMQTLDLGTHQLTFVFAPMVHWPEVMVTYDAKDKVLFSADGFGKFGALDVEEPWDDESRRYYIGIVGKYGMMVQSLLKKAATLDIEKICPLHGPVLTENLAHYLKLYDIWSSYQAEEDGIILAYTSVYGDTKNAVLKLADKLKDNGCPVVKTYDLARTDMSLVTAEVFRYSKVVLATTTYNAGMYPFMNTFIEGLTERGIANKTIGLIENGSWAPQAGRLMKEKLSKMKNITFLDTVTIMSNLNENSEEALDKLATQLSTEYVAMKKDNVNSIEPKALFNIGYGLYVITSNDGKKDNGLIVNTVTQLTDQPSRVMVSINKQNYSHHIIKQTGILNVNCLSIDAPFSVFQQFGFVSGRNVDKFEGKVKQQSANGLQVLPQYINAFMSLKVENYIDMDTHGMFICSVTESRVLSNKETMTYTYYQKNVKPKPNTENKKGWVCKVCGYVHEGDELPDDFICPLCKHGASDFEKIK